MEKKMDVCCHCGKKVGGYYVSPNGYYWLQSSLIGIKEDSHHYRLCIRCYNKFKKIVGDFFKCEGE